MKLVFLWLYLCEKAWHFFLLHIILIPFQMLVWFLLASEINFQTRLLQFFPKVTTFLFLFISVQSSVFFLFLHSCWSNLQVRGCSAWGTRYHWQVIQDQVEVLSFSLTLLFFNLFACFHFLVLHMLVRYLEYMN